MEKVRIQAGFGDLAAKNFAVEMEGISSWG
jgi:hypothetical protein